MACTLRKVKNGQFSDIYHNFFRTMYKKTPDFLQTNPKIKNKCKELKNSGRGKKKAGFLCFLFPILQYF